ncbi:hypothetical protein F5148DRAFT_121614 [Russula earlei]|uniref:Uncharacterized protein n=1 Tax=Russula earlei TaxID=71964 RepID=A0ACC0U747_9AGAM|nr:hypothetical protein F5148DRAFT_121614 [Russula earlei]
MPPDRVANATQYPSCAPCSYLTCVLPRGGFVVEHILPWSGLIPMFTLAMSMHIVLINTNQTTIEHLSARTTKDRDREREALDEMQPFFSFMFIVLEGQSLSYTSLSQGIGMPKFGSEPRFEPRTPELDLRFWFCLVLVLSFISRFGHRFRASRIYMNLVRTHSNQEPTL